jgi:hypothetical protein
VIGNVNASVQLATAREAGTGEGKAEKYERRSRPVAANYAGENLTFVAETLVVARCCSR